MKRRKIWIALGLSITLAVTACCGCSMVNDTVSATTQEPESVTGDNATDIVNNLVDKNVKNVNSGDNEKEETVYVNADANGNVSEITVSNWLKNNQAAGTIDDATTLQDVTNVKGDEEFKEDGNGLIWTADGKDIYYQGTTTKELPVDVAVTYYLDGKEIKPDDLLGKSGEVKIRFDYTNHIKENVEINGETKEVYVPFAAVTATILPTETFSNVEVENGKVISDGSRVIVIGTAMPGLKESLDLDSIEGMEDVNIPEYVEITANAEDFELAMTATVVSADLMQDLDTDDITTVDDLKADIADLEDATQDVIDGSHDLNDGAGDLKDGVAALTDGVDDLDDGAKKLSDGAGNLADGAGTLNDGAGSLVDNLATLKSVSSTLLTGAGTLNNSVIGSGTETSPELSASVAQLDAAAGGINTIVGAIGGTVSTNNSAAGTAATAAAATLASAQSDYASAVDDLQSAITTLGTVTSDTSKSQTDIDTAYTAIDWNGLIGNVNTTAAALATASSDYAGYAGAVNALTPVEAALTTDPYAAAGGLTLPQLTGTVASGTNTLNAQTPALCQGIIGLYKGIAGIDGGADKLLTGASTLKAGTSSLLDGANTLKNATSDLTDGTGKLKDKTGDLKDGVNDFKDGTQELYDGVNDFKTDGIDKLSDAVNVDLQNAMDRMDAVVDAGKDYQTFSGKPDGMNGKVKFIIETAGIEH